MEEVTMCDAYLASYGKTKTKENTHTKRISTPPPPLFKLNLHRT
jgi:hypothetical protein